MKKTKFLVAIIAIVSLISLSFSTFVNATDTEEVSEISVTSQSVNTLFENSYNGSWEVYHQILELAEGNSVTFYGDTAFKTALANYEITSKDTSVIAVEGTKATAIKAGTTTLTFSPSFSTDESVTYTVKVYSVDDYKALRQKRAIQSDLSKLGEYDITGLSSISADNFNLAIEAAKDLGMDTLKINSGDKVIWEFATTGTTASKDFIPTANFSTEKISTIESDAISDALFVDFDYSGDLPGKANITLNIGTDKFGNSDKTLYLYYYNPETKAYEYVEEAAYSAGQVKFNLTHCSSYAIVENKIDAEETTTTRELDNEPKTGESSVLGISALAIVSLAIAVIIRKNI